MRRILPALVMLALMNVSVLADLRGSSGDPAFSPEDLEIIARNAALAAVVGEDPWLVRRVLDANERDGEPPKSDQPPGRGDGARPNPDLDGMERSSPEAAHDLLQLLKRAGAVGPK